MKSGWAALAGMPDSGEYFSRFLGSGQVWGGQIADDTDVPGKIERNLWRLSAPFALVNCISTGVPEGRANLTQTAQTATQTARLTQTAHENCPLASGISAKVP